MTQTERCIEELQRAGLFEKDSDYCGNIGEATKELLNVFQTQEHSGYSAHLVADIFHKLIKGDILTPLTEDPLEWMEVNNEGLLQSTRCHHVFWDKKENDLPYTLDGKVFSDDGGKSYFSNRDSIVYFSLPGYPPKTEHIILK